MKARATMRTFGTLDLEGKMWRIKAQPHVIQVAKRLFVRAKSDIPGEIVITNTPELARDLEWFMQRYPLKVDDADRLHELATRFQKEFDFRESILTGIAKPRQFKLKIPPREYQALAAELMLSQKSLLLGDEVGLGKTCTAICLMAQKATQPVCVVTLTHLPEQWRDEIHKFVPSMSVHIVSKRENYKVTNRRGVWPDVLIVPYSKLAAWRDQIIEHCKLVVWDEAQELRRYDSEKYRSAARIADAMEYRIGLTGTPIYNFGGEMYHVLRCINPGALGTFDEFSREWCNGVGMTMKPRLQDAKAFGTYLKEHHLMLIRTRKEVGRELPELTKVTHFLDPDAKEFAKSENRARELARLILQGSNQQKFMASAEFDMLMRQTTGISKAVQVAAFVDMLINSGEPVVLFGWHRAVYDIWLAELAKHKPAMYTGTESSAEKKKNLNRFLNGETNLLIMSLRAGVGVDGLQFRCKTVVFGEFDWTPGIMEQDIGRVARDGQKDPVMAYMLAVDAGSDPFMMELLGLKQDQVRGIRGQSMLMENKIDASKLMQKLAASYLQNMK